MEDKQQVLGYIASLSRYNVISREELLAAFDQVPVQEVPSQAQPLKKKVSVQDIMYYIGAAIVFIGLVILVSQNWEYLNDATKILVTLGAGICAFISGTLFTKNSGTLKDGLAFHLIGALIIPVGLAITVDIMGVDPEEPSIQTFIAGMLFLMYLLSSFLFKKDLFLLFSILFGTWFYYAATNWVISGTLLAEEVKFFEYQSLVAGLTYILLGYYWSINEKYKGLVGFLYGFGILVFLGAALALGGWEPNQSIFWELIFPVLVLGVLFLSSYLKSSSFLTFGTIFLMLYIIKITGEYFSSGLGWPLALVLAGLLLIGTGYMSVSIKRQFWVSTKLVT